MSILLAPSILSADFSRLGEQLSSLEKAGADRVHVDVMDGHFVPNLTFGPFILPVIQKSCSLPIDVHLMITNPDEQISSFAVGGADLISVHLETCPHLYRTLQNIRTLGCKVGVALNPATGIESLREVIPLLDVVLILGSNPGFSGQGLIPAMVGKIGRLTQFLHQEGSSAMIEVDGGITAQNLAQVYQAGGRSFVSGSAVFNHPAGIAAGISSLRESVLEE